MLTEMLNLINNNSMLPWRNKKNIYIYSTTLLSIAILSIISFLYKEWKTAQMSKFVLSKMLLFKKLYTYIWKVKLWLFENNKSKQITCMN